MLELIGISVATPQRVLIRELSATRRARARCWW